MLREIIIYDDSSIETKLSYLVQEIDKITAIILDLSTSQINCELKNMELNEQRLKFLSDISSGICPNCGSVTDECYCMRDD